MNFSRKTKRTINKIRIFILKSITFIAAMSVVIGACSIDSEGTNIPVLMIVIGLAWIVLIGIANEWFE